MCPPTHPPSLPPSLYSLSDTVDDEQLQGGAEPQHGQRNGYPPPAPPPASYPPHQEDLGYQDDDEVNIGVFDSPIIYFHKWVSAQTACVSFQLMHVHMRQQ